MSRLIFLLYLFIAASQLGKAIGGEKVNIKGQFQNERDIIFSNVLDSKDTPTQPKKSPYATQIAKRTAKANWHKQMKASRKQKQLRIFVANNPVKTHNANLTTAPTLKKAANSDEWNVHVRNAEAEEIKEGKKIPKAESKNIAGQKLDGSHITGINLLNQLKQKRSQSQELLKMTKTYRAADIKGNQSLESDAFLRRHRKQNFKKLNSYTSSFELDTRHPDKKVSDEKKLKHFSQKDKPQVSHIVADDVQTSNSNSTIPVTNSVETWLQPQKKQKKIKSLEKPANKRMKHARAKSLEFLKPGKILENKKALNSSKRKYQIEKASSLDPTRKIKNRNREIKSFEIHRPKLSKLARSQTHEYLEKQEGLRSEENIKNKLHKPDLSALNSNKFYELSSLVHLEPTIGKSPASDAGAIQMIAGKHQENALQINSQNLKNGVKSLEFEKVNDKIYLKKNQTKSLEHLTSAKLSSATEMYRNHGLQSFKSSNLHLIEAAPMDNIEATKEQEFKDFKKKEQTSKNKLLIGEMVGNIDTRKADKFGNEINSLQKIYLTRSHSLPLGYFKNTGTGKENDNQSSLTHSNKPQLDRISYSNSGLQGKDGFDAKQSFGKNQINGRKHELLQKPLSKWDLFKAAHFQDSHKTQKLVAEPQLKTTEAMKHHSYSSSDLAQKNKAGSTSERARVQQQNNLENLYVPSQQYLNYKMEHPVGNISSVKSKEVKSSPAKKKHYGVLENAVNKAAFLKSDSEKLDYGRKDLQESTEKKLEDHEHQRKELQARDIVAHKEKYPNRHSLSLDLSQKRYITKNIVTASLERQDQGSLKLTESQVSHRASFSDLHSFVGKKYTEQKSDDDYGTQSKEKEILKTEHNQTNETGKNELDKGKTTNTQDHRIRRVK